MSKAIKNVPRRKVNKPVLKQIIKDYCFTRLSNRPIPRDIDDDTDMFQSGILDSIDALELLIGFEEDYGFVIPEDLQDVSDLASFNGICRFLIKNIDLNVLGERLGQNIFIG